MLSRPAYAAWHRLTSVRFALGLIAVIAIAALLGVLIPQVPEGMRGSPELHRQFVAGQGQYGAAAPVMDRLGLFTVFHSWWFVSLLGLLTVSVTVCSWSRFAPVRRQVMAPPVRVADGYFDHAHHRARFRAPATGDLPARLRRKHFRVVQVQSGEVSLLYADRFRWAAFGTFASHLSLVIFLVGGLTTWLFEQRTQVLVAEGTSAAVFAPADADHMQVRLLDFHRPLDASGRELGIESDIEVYRHGALLASGKTSINRPLKAGGYVFHQSAFFEQGAQLQVIDIASGRTVFDEVLPLRDTLPVPILRASGADGAVLFEGPLPPSTIVSGLAAAAMLPLPGGDVAVALKAGAGPSDVRLAVSDGGAVREVAVGDELPLRGGAHLAFVGFTASASGTTVLPGTGTGTWLVQMLDGAGRSMLELVSPAGAQLHLSPGEDAEMGGYRYRFGGQRSFAGLTVRNDPGSRFIWIATALLLGGLATTFYVPRCQLWLRREGDEVKVAGVGRFRRPLHDELAWLGGTGDGGGGPGPAD